MAASIEALARLCVEVPPPTMSHCGVYLLLRGVDVVYVGQSTQTDMRVAYHRQALPPGTFDRALMLRVPPDELDAYEGALIRAFQPKLNRRAPRPSPRELAILLELGLPVHQAQRRHREINRSGKPAAGAPDDRRRGRRPGGLS